MAYGAGLSFQHRHLVVVGTWIVAGNGAVLEAQEDLFRDRALTHGPDDGGRAEKDDASRGQVVDLPVGADRPQRFLEGVVGVGHLIDGPGVPAGNSSGTRPCARDAA